MSTPKRDHTEPQTATQGGTGNSDAGRPLRVATTAAVAAVAVIAAAILLWPRGAPTTRHVHIEAFRYGTEPCVIRANRGDRLILTFSSRDTGHSVFLQDYDLDVKVSPGTDIVEVFQPSTPGQPPRRVRQVELTAGRQGFLGALASKARFRCHVYCGPMHGFEQGDLIVWPNYLLVLSLAALLATVIVGASRVLRSGSLHGGVEADLTPNATDLLARFPLLKRLAQWSALHFFAMAPMLALFYLLLLAGVFGTKVAGRNLSVMVIWIAWLFLLTAVLVPLGGRLWCLACPLPLLGDLVQRRALKPGPEQPHGEFRNRFFGLSRPWPRWLNNAWLRTVLFLGMGAFSTLIVSSPRTTAWLLLALFAAATLMPLVWELRAFCRYVCPVSGFIGLFAMAGRLAVRPRDPQVCDDCAPRTCQSGSAKGWACPYGLCVGEVERNSECGVCTECVKTCPYDNVALRWRPFATDRRLRDTSEAVLSTAMLVLAVAYCLTHLGPWPEMRNYVDLLDAKRWDLFWRYAAALWALALVVAPGAVWAAAWAGKRLSASPSSTKRLFLDSAAALVPLGLMTWVAFVVPLIMVHATFVLMTLSDPLGWNWDLLGTAGMPWTQLWPAGIPWLQAAAILIGVGYTLRNGLLNWREHTTDDRQALAGLAPFAIGVVALGGALLWFFTN